MFYNKVLLCILPIFWPKMPPLGIAYLESYLRNKGIYVDILDLNNYYYNLAHSKLKKSWLISCNKSLEENIISVIQQDYPSQFDNTINKMLQYDVIGKHK
ncbi:MAG: hypothetical protein HY934_06705 [Candidatus Firestonebacteria bacterium]|nr:hypothetical protein [Candidatus Firestonebacteria bacterium]